MKKLTLVTTLVVGALAMLPTDSWAQRVMSLTYGTCQVGSCAKDGSSTAKDVRYCSPKNCRVPVSKNRTPEVRR